MNYKLLSQTTVCRFIEHKKPKSKQTLDSLLWFVNHGTWHPFQLNISFTCRTWRNPIPLYTTASSQECWRLLARTASFMSFHVKMTSSGCCFFADSLWVCFHDYIFFEMNVYASGIQCALSQRTEPLSHSLSFLASAKLFWVLPKHFFQIKVGTDYLLQISVGTWHH